ncbi:zinc finger protein ZAT5-like [Phalaenopsis equestris]|uniref:zinc finger protein ZAT5-like n=1 Tax=Phalaenopsis equestris TaxID=78828 RepID=UPI0009E623BB|nr:zinc finger protein ZAT5-like [Phalaenopsis equestris]
MDSTEEAMVNPHVLKGRRTKRQRHLPVAAAPASSSSSEEEDMANCLILLAQGPPPDSAIKETEEIGAEKKPSRGVTGFGKAGFFLHECRTCNKCFPSYQALGGHRTSHKKPKLTIPSVGEDQTGEIGKELIQLNINSFSNSKIGKIARVHECLICGSEFSSGQALGGHMRRHRQTSMPETVEEKKAEKSSIVMTLDLNLPASDDDYCCSGGGELPTSSSTFSFASKPPLLMSTSALVDCFY